MLEIYFSTKIAVHCAVSLLSDDISFLQHSLNKSSVMPLDEHKYQRYYSKGKITVILASQEKMKGERSSFIIQQVTPLFRNSNNEISHHLFDLL